MRYLFLTGALLFSLLFSRPLAQPNTDSPKKLGADLFSDPILSLDYSLSCASCHRPDFAFADTLALSPGIEGRLGQRNVPSLLHVGNRRHLFWDGRAGNLAEQALLPIANNLEMGLAIDSALLRLQQHPNYAPRFKALFGEAPTAAHLGTALAAFQQSLLSKFSFDRYDAGDEAAITASAKRGQELFAGKGQCFECHFGADMTSDEFRNIGLYNGKNYADVGRFAETHDSSDLGSFRTPALRNVAITAPYMHDGSIATLREVLEYYNHTAQKVPDAINRDAVLDAPLQLSEQELIDLENFLISLTDEQYWGRVKWVEGG